MSIYKRLVASTGCIAVVTAGTVLFAAVDGGSAKEGARVGGNVTSSIVNTIHPIIYDPSHKSDHCHKHHHRCHDKVRFLGPPIPAPTYPPKPVASAPGNAVPVKTFPAY